MAISYVKQILKGPLYIDNVDESGSAMVVLLQFFGVQGTAMAKMGMNC